MVKEFYADMTRCHLLASALNEGRMLSTEDSRKVNAYVTRNATTTRAAILTMLPQNFSFVAMHVRAAYSWAKLAANVLEEEVVEVEADPEWAKVSISDKLIELADLLDKIAADPNIEKYFGKKSFSFNAVKNAKFIFYYENIISHLLDARAWLNNR